jgi:putative sigma-54 modulation protein
MQISVTFRHMSTSDTIKKHAMEKVERIQKFLDDATEVHVVLSIERHLHKADIHMQSNGVLIRGEESSSDMYNSIDRAVEKIEKQLKRYRTKIQKHRASEGVRLKLRIKMMESAESADSESASELPPTITETKEFDARPMMLDEALMQMDLLHNDILVFLNVKTDHINVLYRKKGNKFGLIEASNT